MRYHFSQMFLLGALVTAGMAQAGDSPQFRGIHRDGKFDETGSLKTWPEGGPPVAWVAKGIGSGFSSAAVANGKIYVTGMTEDEIGHVYVLDNTGEIEQSIAYGKETVCKEAPGARSTTTIDGDRAYFISGLGVVYCVDLAKGEKLWEVDSFNIFEAENPTWHLAESLLIDGDCVLCTPVGKKATVAALDKMTGKTVWVARGLEDTPSYCSPIIAEHKGRRIFLGESGKYIFGVDPDKHALLWSFEQKVPWNIHAVTPVFGDGLVFYTAGDGRGGGALELSPDGSTVTPKWTSTELDSLHHGVVLADGYLYGTSSKRRSLVCLEMATGKTMWNMRDTGECVTVYADGMLYLYSGPKTGVVSLVKAQPNGFERTGQFTVTEGEGQHWAHPAIAHGRLYIRHGDALIAYDVTAH